MGKKTPSAGEHFLRLHSDDPWVEAHRRALKEEEDHWEAFLRGEDLAPPDGPLHRMFAQLAELALEASPMNTGSERKSAWRSGRPTTATRIRGQSTTG